MIQLVPIVLAQVALLAGGPVKTSCVSLAQDDGLTWAAARTIQLDTADVCKPANRFAAHPNKRSEYGSWSLYILGHEAAHIAHPDYSEATATCAGLIHLPQVARALGASEKTAAWMQASARVWADSMPKRYRSRCTAGTSLKIRTQPGMAHRSHITRR